MEARRSRSLMPWFRWVRGRGGAPAIGAALGGLAYALLTGLALPPANAWWLAPLAPVPLVFAAHLWDRRFWLGGLLAGAGTLPLWLYEQSWTRLVSGAGYVPLALVLAVYPALFVWALARVRARWPGMPVWLACGVLWTGLEFLRGAVAFDGYPWFLAAHPLIAVPKLAAPASILGTYAVGFLVVGLGGALVGLGLGRRRESLIGLILIAGAWILLAAVGGAERGRGTIRVGIVQTNVPQDVRGTWAPEQRVEDLESLLSMTREVAAEDPDLIVWPETMFPGYYLDPQSVQRVQRASDRFPQLAQIVDVFVRALTRTQSQLGVPMIVGARAYEGLEIGSGSSRSFEPAYEATYNSTFLVRGGGIAPSRYDKMHLTPFGEVMPYISAWPWLERRMLEIGVGAEGMAFDLDAGDEPVRFEVGGRRVATPICFEATMPGVCRRLAYEGGQRRADLLVNATNDGWFGGFDPGRRQHALSARWRCVELGLPMVRVANTGISGAIDPWGRVIEAMPARESGMRVVEVPLARGGTVYGRIGDAFGWASLGGAILLVGSAYVRQRRRD